MDLIRGQSVDRALATLRFSRKRIAGDVAKVLRSAVANAEQKEGAAGDIDRMFVSKCYADQGPSMKRIRPAPMGARSASSANAHLTFMSWSSRNRRASGDPGRVRLASAQPDPPDPGRRSTKSSKRRPRKRSSD
ncbi:50S ribosomal protein L22 [Geodia barretti]|nr:50S ribosomal protein L22 [Geodia barretti]